MLLFVETCFNQWAITCRPAVDSIQIIGIEQKRHRWFHKAREQGPATENSRVILRTRTAVLFDQALRYLLTFSPSGRTAALARFHPLIPLCLDGVSRWNISRWGTGAASTKAGLFLHENHPGRESKLVGS